MIVTYVLYFCPVQELHIYTYVPFHVSKQLWCIFFIALHNHHSNVSITVFKKYMHCHHISLRQRAMRVKCAKKSAFVATIFCFDQLDHAENSSKELARLSSLILFEIETITLIGNYLPVCIILGIKT